MGKKVNFFGVEMEVVDEQGLLEQTGPEGKHLVICARVADITPAMDAQQAHSWPQSVQRRIKVRCTLCREIIWYDPASSPYPPGAVRVCMPCMLNTPTEQLEALTTEES